MVVVDVLAQPAFELVVFLEQQLEGLTDDVGRVRIDELRVPVDFVSDFLLQADLKSCGFRLLSWCFQKCHVLFLLSLSVNHYSLHYKLFAPTPARGQNTAPSYSGRAGAIPRYFGRLKAVKSGVAPARFSVLPAVTFVCIASLSPTLKRNCSGHRLKNL